MCPDLHLMCLVHPLLVAPRVNDPSQENSGRLALMLIATKRSAAPHSYVLVEVLVTAEIKFPFRSYVYVFATALFVAWVALSSQRKEHWLLSGRARSWLTVR